jgi:hypothetical protein
LSLPNIDVTIDDVEIMTKKPRMKAPKHKEAGERQKKSRNHLRAEKLQPPE